MIAPLAATLPLSFSLCFLSHPFNYANAAEDEDDNGLTLLSPGGKGNGSICWSCKAKGRGVPSAEAGILLMKEGPRDPAVSPARFILINSPADCYSASQPHL